MENTDRLFIELAKIKAIFQQRAICAVIGIDLPRTEECVQYTKQPTEEK
jgi:hypothetical protein